MKTNTKRITHYIMALVSIVDTGYYWIRLQNIWLYYILRIGLPMY